MTYDWLFCNPHGDTGSRRRSKNNLRGIRMGIGPVWGINSHPLLMRGMTQKILLILFRPGDFGVPDPGAWN